MKMSKTSIATLKRLVFYLILSFWTLLVNVPIYQRTIFFVALFSIIYFGLSTQRHKYYYIGASVLLYALICLYFSGTKVFIKVMSEHWPMFAIFPVIMVYAIFKKISTVKYLALSVILIILFRYSTDIYTILDKINEYRYNWAYFLLFIFKLLFYAIIPYELYKRTSNLTDISFDFEFKTLLKSTTYFLLLIAIHQLLILAIDRTLHIPSYSDFLSVLGYFSTNLSGPGIIEEILYRGILYNVLIAIFNSKQKGMYITAGIFGFMHFQFGLMYIGYTFIVSVIFTKLYQKTNSLFYPTVLHGLLNIYL